MTYAVAFDFTAKRMSLITEADAEAHISDGAYVWIDVSDIADAERLLNTFQIDSGTIERVVADQAVGTFNLGRNCIHASAVETKMEGGDLQRQPLHIILTDSTLITVHSAPSHVIDEVKNTFADDFRTLAQSGGFLLFEIADHLIANYREQLAALTKSVEDVQQRLLTSGEDEILAEVSDLTRALLDYRNAAITARETIHELATRRSPYVSETTQPFLDRQTVALERLAGDAATERSVLSETLALYMGIVSHRTTRIVSHLTIVSVIFLPLNFLAAVYGMNFKDMPELQWDNGYLVFWAVSAFTVVLLLIAMRRWRWF